MFARAGVTTLVQEMKERGLRSTSFVLTGCAAAGWPVSAAVPPASTVKAPPLMALAVYVQVKVRASPAGTAV